MKRHGPLEEHAVDAKRVGERLPQPWSWCYVQGEGTVAVLQVEVEEKDAAVLPIGQMPCQVYSQRCCADTASGTNGSNYFSELSDYRLPPGRSGRRQQSLRQELRSNRLYDVFVDPGLH